MSIDSWANDQEIMGNFLKFPENGLLKMIFLDDGKKTQIKGTGDNVVEFAVEHKGNQWKFSTSSKRLLTKLKEVAAKNKNTLIGLCLEIQRTGDKFQINYTVKIMAGKKE
jgi:hypothetical protein